MLFPQPETCAAATQQAATKKRPLDLCMIKLHQLSLHEITFDHAKSMRYGLQGGHPFRSMLGAQMKLRGVRSADLHPWYVLQFMMPGMNFARLPPGSVGNNQLNRRPFSRHKFMIQFHGIDGGVKQKSPIPIGQEISQVERFSCFSPYPHLAI